MVVMEIQKEKNRTVVQERFLIMKIGKQTIIPVAIILILGLYLGFHSTGKMNYKIPTFNIIDSKKITIIEIEGISENLKIYNDNGVWRFSSDDLRIEQSKVTEMLSFLVNPDFVDLISDSGNYINYGLESKEYITVKAWTDNNKNYPARELYIGNINTTGNFTFIRRPDYKSVFTVRGNTKGLFDITKNSLIDKRVLNINISSINKIILSFSDASYTLEKTVGDSNEDIWTSSEDIAIEKNKLEQSLRYLSNSRFNTYIENRDSVIPDLLFQIDLFGESLSEKVIISEKKDEIYYGESTFAVKHFSLSENTGTQIIKMFTDLIKIKEE